MPDYLSSVNNSLLPYLGSGGGKSAEGGGRGGGRVFIKVENTLTLSGNIIADGSKSTQAAIGSGSGGSISVTAKYLDIPTSTATPIVPTLSACGGDADMEESAPGGGGRIYLVYFILYSSFLL
jgi:hypothetical protein